MASTYSDLKIELIGTGDQSGTWGSTTNTNLGTAIEEAITGRATANFSTDANLTLGYTDVNTTQVFRNLILNVTSGVSLTATRDLIVPTIEKQYLVENNTTGNQSIVVKTSAGTGITIPNGKKAHVYANGTNVVQASDLFPTIDINGGTIDGTTIGGASAAAGTFTTATATTGNITTVNSTTVDTTNLEVTNIKAIDGTAAASIANSTGVVTVTAAPVISALTASQAVFTTAGKALTSNAITGTGNVVMSTSPTLVTPVLGTPTSGTLTNCTSLPISTGVSGLGSGVATFLATPSSTNLRTAVTDETGSGSLVFATSPTLVTPVLGTPTSGTLTSCTGLPVSTGVSGLGTNVATALAVNVGSAGAVVVNGGVLGTPSSGTLTSCTGLPISTGVSGLGTGVATFLATPSSANLAAAVTDETGTGALVFANTPTLVTPNIGAATGTSLAVTTVDTTNLQVTNIKAKDGTAAATIANSTGVVSITANPILSGGTANGVLYLNGSKVATSGSALTFDGTNLGVGVTLSAWTTYPALEISNTGAVGFKGQYGNFAANAYFVSGFWKYSTSTGNACLHQLDDGAYKWFTAPSGTAGNAITFSQVMTLDASGNLVIGTTGTAQGRVHAHATTNAQFVATDATLGTTYGGVFRGYGVVGQGGNAELGVLDNSTYTKAIKILDNATNILFFTGVNNVGNAERARITSGGSFCVHDGTVVDLALVTFAKTTETSPVLVIKNPQYSCDMWSTNTSGDNVWVRFFSETSATQRGSIAYNRAGGVVAYNTTSDYRAKDILGPVTDTGTTIDALKVYNGKMKGATQSRPMLVAHEAQEVAPYAVTGEKDAVNDDGAPKYQQMDVSSFVPLLIAEIQSLRQRVAQLEGA